MSFAQFVSIVDYDRRLLIHRYHSLWLLVPLYYAKSWTMALANPLQSVYKKHNEQKA